MWRKVNDKQMETMPEKGMKTAEEAPKLQLMIQAGMTQRELGTKCDCDHVEGSSSAVRVY